MAIHPLPGSPGIGVVLRQSARARRISLRVSQLDGRVTLTLPKGVSERQALDFAQEKSRWIAEALARRAEPVTVVPGVEIPVEGQVRSLFVGEGRSARLVSGGRLSVPEGRAGTATQALLKHLARDRLAAAVDRYASEVARTPGRLTLRDTRSRWGSCSSQGNLMFSWRLIMAPKAVLDYVAAHEVAHLVHMNHSAAFWALVAEICPGHRASRRWLREEGAGLHRYQFDK